MWRIEALLTDEDVIANNGIFCYADPFTEFDTLIGDDRRGMDAGLQPWLSLE